MGSVRNGEGKESARVSCGRGFDGACGCGKIAVCGWLHIKTRDAGGGVDGGWIYEIGVTRVLRREDRC